MASCLRRAAWTLPCVGELLSLTSSPMAPRRSGSVPWVPRRPPYAIMPSAYGSRRSGAFETDLPRCLSCSQTSWPLAPAAFLNSGAHQTGQCKKKHVTAVAARSLHRSRSRRRRAPRLASCLSRAGPGSREFLAPTTRRWGGHPACPAAITGSLRIRDPRKLQACAFLELCKGSLDVRVLVYKSTIIRCHGNERPDLRGTGMTW